MSLIAAEFDGAAKRFRVLGLLSAEEALDEGLAHPVDHRGGVLYIVPGDGRGVRVGQFINPRDLLASYWASIRRVMAAMKRGA